jgi:hypothetical protein
MTGLSRILKTLIAFLLLHNVGRDPQGGALTVMEEERGIFWQSYEAKLN